MIGQKADSSAALSEGEKPPRMSRKTILIALGGTLALVFLAYRQALHFGFVSDDKFQILGDPWIASWKFVPAYFTGRAWDLIQGYHGGNYYRPVFLLWLLLNYSLFKLHAFGWHFAAILLHLAVTALVFLLARTLTRDSAAALIAALIFGLHPAHIESVVWLSGATEALAALFVLASLLCYLKRRQGGGWPWLAVSLVAFAAGALAQETALILPVVIVAYEWLWRGTSPPPSNPSGAARRFMLTRGFLGDFWPFIAMTLVYSVARWRALGSLGHELAGVPLAVVFFTIPSILLFYLKHLVWPFGLSLYYKTDVVRAPDLRNFFIPLLVLVAIGIGIFAWTRREASSGAGQSRSVLFASVWAFAFLLPVLDFALLIPGEETHDRYLYLPSVGFAIALGLALRRLRFHRPVILGLPAIPLAGVLTIAAAYGISIPRQDACWASNFDLYKRAFATAPDNDTVQLGLAMSLRDRGEDARAVALYRQILARRPGNSRAAYGLGYTYYWEGNPQKAAKYFERTVALDPSNAGGFFYLGLSLLKLGRTADAEAAFRQAIHLEPDGFAYHLALGLTLSLEGRLAGALREFRAELSNYPEETAARRQLLAVENKLAGKNAEEHLP